MKCIGWTQEQHSEALRLGQIACDSPPWRFRTFDLIERWDGVPSYNVRLHFMSRPRKLCKEVTKRLLNRQPFYRAGVGYNIHSHREDWEIEPVPWSELYEKGQPRERVSYIKVRGTGSLCWHAHGHYMWQLFKQNKTGRISTTARGSITYNGQENFLKQVMYFQPRNPGCDCKIHKTERFWEY